MKGKISSLISDLTRINIELWHEEDKARSGDDAQVVNAKRAIDKLNQRRNDMIESIDDACIGLLGKKHG